MIISLSNNKGGVLKTTLATNIASVIASQGKKVCLLDLDPQSNIATTFKTRKEIKSHAVSIIEYLKGTVTIKELVDTTINPNLKNQLGKGVLAAIYSDRNLNLYDMSLVRGEYKSDRVEKLVDSLNKIFDYVVIDTQPALNLLTGEALRSSDLVIIPFEPDKYAVNGVATILDMLDKEFKQKKHKVLCVPTKVNIRSAIHKEWIEIISGHTDKYKFAKMSDSFIKTNTQSTKVVSYENLPISFSLKKNKSIEQAKQDYKELVSEILEYVK